MQKTDQAVVFVSSTVYDLIDIRSELEAEIASMGMIPILSESASSDFCVPRDRDSILPHQHNVSLRSRWCRGASVRSIPIR